MKHFTLILLSVGLTFLTPAKARRTPQKIFVDSFMKQINDDKIQKEGH